MKTITLFLSIFLLGCNGVSKKGKDSYSDKESKSCVNQIFEKDSIFGDIRNQASEDISLSEAINNYSNNSNSLDYSHCPKGFESAFHKHIDAWLDFRKVSDKYP